MLWISEIPFAELMVLSEELWINGNGVAGAPETS